MIGPKIFIRTSFSLTTKSPGGWVDQAWQYLVSRELIWLETITAGPATGAGGRNR